MTPTSERGYFDYHFISTEPTERVRSVTVYDRDATRTVRIREENDEGELVVVDTYTVPDWKPRQAEWPVMQYVICDGDGVVVERIPVRGSRRAQAAKASSRLGAYMAMEA